jgi:hypothetical protein
MVECSALMMAGALPEMILRDDELEDFLFMIYFLLYGSAFRCSCLDFRECIGIFRAYDEVLRIRM